MVGIAAFGQQPGLFETVRDLNNKALQAHAAAIRQGSKPSAPPANVAELLRERGAALTVLIDLDPAAALSLAFSDEVLSALRHRFKDSTKLLETNGAWTGTADYIVADDQDLQVAQTRTLLQTAGETLEVHFSEGDPPNLQSGSVLVIEGVRLNGKVAAATVTTTTATATRTDTGTTTCGPIGQQKIAVIMATFPGLAPPSITKDQVAAALWGTTGRTLDGFWRENSYGQTYATGGVYGWYTLDKTYSCSDLSGMTAAAIRAADGDVNFTGYNRVFVLTPPPTGCAYAGLSYVGCSSLSTRDGTISASSSWMRAGYFANRDRAVELSSHEAGHGLGLMHARSRDFGSEPLGALGASGTIATYGDRLSTMGTWGLGHYTAPHKAQLRWQTSANSPVVQSSGSYTLAPAEVATTGTQSLKVQRGTGNSPWLWIEYRQPLGSYDSTLPSTAFSGALIHYADSVTGRYSDLLDFTPATSGFSDAPLAIGQLWVDPYSNVRMAVQGKSSAGLNVEISYGAIPCVRANPKLSLSPANPSVYPGGTASYTFSVTNNDSSGCSSSAFSLSSAVPSGWTSSVSNSMLTLAPAQSGSVTLKKTAPAYVAPGTYSISAVATHGSESATASASCTVMAGP